MTQEEKTDVIPQISSINDNMLLQNEFLSKLINTRPNLTPKYENEELNKFKDEMLLYINERNNHILTLINYFQDKINQTKEEYTSKLNLINQNYEAILSSQASIINKVDKISNIELFMNKTNDQIITHEIRINNISQDFIKAVQKYDKIYLDNLELPGYIGKFAKFKNCQNFFDFLIREIDKINLYKEKNNIDLRNYKEKLENTIKSFHLLFKNNNEAQMKYIRQINEKNFRECKDMNDALSSRVCDLRIENAKYSMDLIKKSEEMGKDWNKILKIKDEMLDTVNEKINNFRKVFNGNTTIFNEFRKEYEEFKIKINDILNYFKEFKNMNENNNNSPVNNNINNNNNHTCNNYTGCYINSALPLEKKNFKNFSKFGKRSKSKNKKNLDKRTFIKNYMTINGNKNNAEKSNNNSGYDNNNGSNNGLIHIECLTKEKKHKNPLNENQLKKSACGPNTRSSKSLTKIEINSINKVFTSREEIRNNKLLNDNLISNDNNIHIKINEDENKIENIDNENINVNENNENNNIDIQSHSEMNLQNIIKINNELNSKDTLNSTENNKEKEKEQILLKINKKSRRSFAPSSKSIISYESENNNINDISNITSNQKNDDLNLMNNSLYSTNSFNINMNKILLNDNIMEANQQVIRELASELEQSTNKKDLLNSNKKKIEENFKINRNKISKLNLNKTNNIMDMTNSTEKTDDKYNNNINISISGTINRNSNPNSDNNMNIINKKLDIFDKKLFNLEAILKEKIIAILYQMEKLQNYFNFSFNNKIPIASSKIKGSSLYNNSKETNFNFNNFNINTSPNTNLGKNDLPYDYLNSISKRNSQDDYFIGCSVRRLAPIIEIDVNNLQFSPSHTRTQYKVYSSKKKESRNKWNKSGITTNFKDIKIKRNENKENIRPFNSNFDSNNNGTQIRLFGKERNLVGMGVNKWINLNKLIDREKSSKDNNPNNNGIVLNKE